MFREIWDLVCLKIANQRATVWITTDLGQTRQVLFSRRRSAPHGWGAVGARERAISIYVIPGSIVEFVVVGVDIWPDTGIGAWDGSNTRARTRTRAHTHPGIGRKIAGLFLGRLSTKRSVWWNSVAIAVALCNGVFFSISQAFHWKFDETINDRFQSLSRIASAIKSMESLRDHS